jgi:hypothetical protein
MKYAGVSESITFGMSLGVGGVIRLGMMLRSASATDTKGGGCGSIVASRGCDAREISWG